MIATFVSKLLLLFILSHFPLISIIKKFLIGNLIIN